MAQSEPGRAGHEPADSSGTEGSIKPEPVSDRPNVGVVEPSDYPDPARLEPPGE